MLPQIPDNEEESNDNPIGYDDDHGDAATYDRRATAKSGSWSLAQLLTAVWTYNGRSILFVVIFGLTTLAILPVTMDIYIVNFDKLTDR